MKCPDRSEFEEYAFSLGLTDQWLIDDFYNRLYGSDGTANWKAWLKEKVSDRRGRFLNAVEVMAGEARLLRQEISGFRSELSRNHLKEQLSEIAKMIREITVKEVAKQLRLSVRTIQRNLRKLGKTGSITVAELGKLRELTARKRPDVARRNRQNKADRNDVSKKLQKSS